jgi:hypothetical protein
VTGAERDAKVEALLLDGLHALESVLVERGHVVVRELLTPGGLLADDSAASQLEIEAAGIGVTGDQEELLLETDVGDDTLGVVSEVLQQADTLARDSLA